MIRTINSVNSSSNTRACRVTVFSDSIKASMSCSVVMRFPPIDPDAVVVDVVIRLSAILSPAMNMRRSSSDGDSTSAVGRLSIVVISSKFLSCCRSCCNRTSRRSLCSRNNDFALSNAALTNPVPSRSFTSCSVPYFMTLANSSSGVKSSAFCSVISSSAICVKSNISSVPLLLRFSNVDTSDDSNGSFSLSRTFKLIVFLSMARFWLIPVSSLSGRVGSFDNDFTTLVISTLLPWTTGFLPLDGVADDITSWFCSDA